MPPTDPPIDVTDILAQPREFAQRLARVERERAELIETVARLRAECNDAQAVARAYILRAEAAENKMLREMVDVDVVIAVMAERDAARAEVARLTAAAERLLKMHTRPDGTIWSDTSMVEGALMDLRAALRQPAPEQPLDDDGVCKCGHARGQHRGVCMIFPCKCMEFTAPAQPDATMLSDNSLQTSSQAPAQGQG